MNSTYHPQKLDDIVWPSPVIRKDVQAITDLHFECNLLLYGPPGTGKTTLANLIPDLIEGAPKTAGPMKINGSADSSIDTVRGKIDNFARLMPTGSKQYIIIEEADGLTHSAQKALKVVMDYTEIACMFILTTNHLEKIDEAIRSRCHLLHMNPASTEDWIPRAQSILKSRGMKLNNDAVRKLIHSANGDGRQIIRLCLQSASRFLDDRQERSNTNAPPKVKATL